MSYPEAKEIVLKLTAMSDVLIENFTPRVMSNWGLDYEKLREVKPNLIMISISAMGQTGPWRDFVAFGPPIQALSGLTVLTSYDPAAPLGLGYAYADSIAGLYAVLSILAAMEYRDKMGQGQYIDLSAYESMCTLLGPALLDVSLNKQEVRPHGNRSEYLNAAPYGCYKCLGLDRWCVIAVHNEEEWHALCQALGQPVWTREEEFSNLSKRNEHADELDQLLGQWTGQHTAEEVVELLQKVGVPAGVVQNAEDLARDPHLKAREFFTYLEHSLLGSTIADRSPIKFNDDSVAGWKAAPTLGEDNRYVYMELLGLTEEEFSSYVEKGVIG
jgi:crotonobetainyl-CoA:carnitine CoA-transferase CaiB-like acyl-CoA transferase